MHNLFARLLSEPEHVRTLLNPQLLQLLQLRISQPVHPLQEWLLPEFEHKHMRQMPNQLWNMLLVIIEQHSYCEMQHVRGWLLPAGEHMQIMWRKL